MASTSSAESECQSHITPQQQSSEEAEELEVVDVGADVSGDDDEDNQPLPSSMKRQFEECEEDLNSDVEG